MAAQVLTFARAAQQTACKECESSERSGIRIRQRGFFVPGIQSTAGRATDTTPGNGEEVHRLRSAFNLPATMPARVKAFRYGFSELTQERFMPAAALRAESGADVSQSSLPEDFFALAAKPANGDPILTALDRASATLELIAEAAHDPRLFEALAGVRVHIEQARCLLEARS